MKLFALAALAAAVVGLGACSSDTDTDTDNPTDPTPTNPEFTVAKSGSTFQYDQFVLTGTAASPTAAPNGSGVATVGANALVGERTAQVIFDAFLSAANEPSLDTNQYHEAGGVLSKWYRIGSPALGNLPAIVAGKAWVVASHPTLSSWTALDTTISNVSFTYGGFPLTGTVKMKIMGNKVGTPDVTVDGKTISTVHTRFNVEASIQSEVPIVGPVSISLAFSEEHWFGKNVGLVRYERLPFVLPATPPIIPAPQDIPGRRIVLKAYVLAP